MCLIEEMAAEVPRILVTSERSGSCKRRSDLRVTEDTPGAQKSVAKRSGSPLAFSAVDDRGKESLRGELESSQTCCGRSGKLTSGARTSPG